MIPPQVPKSYNKSKIIAIVGPTTTGKSELAVTLAKKYKGEIVCADSRTVYKDLNIGTAKPPGRWLSDRHTEGAKRVEGPKKRIIDGRHFSVPERVFVYKSIPHHLIDFLSPDKTFSAADFVQKARKKITEIKKRGHLPIVCGGTGFWIDALLNPSLLPDVPPDAELRKKLEKKTAAQLFLRLKILAPNRVRSVDRNNKRRLIRAIEIARARHLRRFPSLQRRESSLFSVLYLGRTLPNGELKKRINKRFLRWLKQGLVSETEKLSRKVNGARLREIGLTYPIVAEYAEGKIIKEQMIERSVNSIYHYAKRQKTWFGRNKKIRWIRAIRQAQNTVDKFLKET